MNVRLAVAATALVLLAACGDGSEATDGPEPTVSTPSADPRTTAPTPAGTRLTGVAAVGDDRCVTLTTTTGQRKTWLLVGPTAGISAGDRVTVRGSPAPDLATRCQLATPFVVEAVEPG